MSSFEPFRSVVIPKGKAGAGFDPNAPADPAGARATRTIILEGPALDPDAISTTPPPSARGTTVTGTAISRPASPSSEDSSGLGAKTTSEDVFVLATEPAEVPRKPAATAAKAPPPAPLAVSGAISTSVSPAPRAPRAAAGRSASAKSGAPPALRQYVVAYEGHLVGTYRCAKRIQNRTAYLKVAEQLVGQIEAFDPRGIRLYRLSEVAIADPIRREELGMSFHNFPRDDVPAPPAPGV